MTRTSAQTVVPLSSHRVPQRRDSRATIRRPRPPVVLGVGSPSSGWVDPPPSLTQTRTLSSSRSQATRMPAPGSGPACCRALLSSSLITRAASVTADAHTPASMRSDTKCRRATPTLDAVNGTCRTLDSVTPTSARLFCPTVRKPGTSGKCPVQEPWKHLDIADVAAVTVSAATVGRVRGEGTSAPVAAGGRERLGMYTGNGSEPTVIVDDLHVVSRVFGAGGDKGTAATALMRLVKRQRRPSVREVHAIRGISFVASHGDAIGVIRRNGSGKSTLLQAIAGLLPPERGCVYTSGQAALLGVNAALLDDLTGERNVVLGGLAMGMTPQEVKDRYESIVDFSGVGNFIDYPMRTYSTGMAQRLRFSIASAKSHEILMIDEALATGDANFRAKSHEKIMQLRGEAGTVFLVAHNLGEIEASCNRVLWLEKGQIMMQGDDVPGIIDAYLEATGGEPRRRDRVEVDHTAG